MQLYHIKGTLAEIQRGLESEFLRRSRRAAAARAATPVKKLQQTLDIEAATWRAAADMIRSTQFELTE